MATKLKITWLHYMIVLSLSTISFWAGRWWQYEGYKLTQPENNRFITELDGINSDTIEQNPSETATSLMIDVDELQQNNEAGRTTYLDKKGVALNGLYSITYKRPSYSYDLVDEIPYVVEIGLFNKGLKQGVWRTHFLMKNEMLDYTETYKDGLLDGSLIAYNADGSAYLEHNLAQGNGLWRSFYATGRVRMHGDYENGLKEGRWIEYKFDGRIDEVVFYKKGVVQRRSED